MAMTRKEAAEMESLRKQLAEAKALRYSGLPEPERLPIPTAGRVNGWDFNSYGDGKVDRCWTEMNAHGFGHLPTGARTVTGSQRGGRLYATRLDALIGLRLAKERDCAALLARIDRMIEEEQP